MSIELIVPTLGESITEATVSKWLKKVGESFEVDEPLVEIETDKITVEVPAPSAGVLSEITVQEGKDVNIGGVLGIIGDAAEITPSKENKSSEPKVVKEESKEFPSFVYHYTDYSPDRKDPLKKEIKVSENQKEIEMVLKTELEDNVKKGWEKVN